jgi:hypothetical protein
VDEHAVRLCASDPSLPVPRTRQLTIGLDATRSDDRWQQRVSGSDDVVGSGSLAAANMADTATFRWRTGLRASLD